MRQALEQAVVSGEEIVRRARARPVSALRWLPIQREFLADPYPYKQLRAGNQTIGKTTAALALVIGHCLGEHPLGEDGYDVAPPPVHWWLVVSSQKQGVQVQLKLRDLLPWGDLDPRTEFDPVRGFRPVNEPIVLFANGSTIRIRTTGNAGKQADTQRALDFASASIDGVLWDEPPRNQRLFTESIQRVQHLGGSVFLSYTPINAPTWYLRELCESGFVHDHWAPLTPEELIPVGAVEPLRTKDGRVKDAAWIDERIRAVPAHEVPVVVHGEWETRSVDRYFTPFRDGGGDSHVHDRVPQHEVDLALGVDHGSGPGKQIAVLMCVWRDRPADPWRVYVLDEYCDPTGRATPRDDARGILAMLRRHDVAWRSLSFAGGDKVHEQGKAQQKSNRDLVAHVALALGVRQDEVHPPIRTIKRGAARGSGSVGIRSRWLYHRMCEADGFGVHSRCERVRHALHRYDLRDNEHKDPIDAIVYGLDPWIFGGGLPVRGAPVQFG